MHQLLRRFTPIIFAIFLLTLAGCARSTTPARSTAAIAPKATATSSAAKPVEVQVSLSEFKIESSMTTFSTGVPYHFVITNKGSVPHEFRIIPPVSGQKTPEELDKMTLAMVGQDKLPAGATATLDYTFTKPAPAGTLEFACHLPGHYEAGMKLAIVVQ